MEDKLLKIQTTAQEILNPRHVRKIVNIRPGTEGYQKNFLYCEIHDLDGNLTAACDVAFALRVHKFEIFVNGQEVLSQYLDFMKERISDLYDGNK